VVVVGGTVVVVDDGGIVVVVLVVDVVGGRVVVVTGNVDVVGGNVGGRGGVVVDGGSPASTGSGGVDVVVVDSGTLVVEVVTVEQSGDAGLPATWALAVATKVQTSRMRASALWRKALNITGRQTRRTALRRESPVRPYLPGARNAPARASS
jgi:hypothetical protein